MCRLMALARHAARTRSSERMGRLAAGIEFLRRGHTAGETRIVESWTLLPERELFAQLGRLPVELIPGPAEGVELIGLLLMEPMDPLR